MKNLYLFTLFDADGGRPRCSGVLAGEQVQIFDLYRPGARKPITVIDDNKDKIKQLVLKASSRGINVVTNDFKNHLRAFDLPLDLRTYNVYDLAILPDVKPTDSLAKDTELLKKILERMSKTKIKEWNKLYANAAVVYQDLENRGIWNNFNMEKPIWSQKVYSGRSKTMGFNIQGFTEPHQVLPPGSTEKDVLLHFDWISADIRVAALLSGDRRLEEAFENSDPYTFMMREVNERAPKPLDRDECKLFLLQSINSMDFTSIALTQIYPQLGEWIGRCKKVTAEDGGYLETIMGRRFKVANAKNALAVLNGVQQGSVAHAMQNVIRRVWERLGHRLVMEGHDSLVVSCPPDRSEVKATMMAVGQIMLYPFDGLLPDNPSFPLKVSIGKKWRQWKLGAVFRKSGVEYVQSQAAAGEGEGRGEEAASSAGEGGAGEGPGEEAGGEAPPGD